MRPPPPTAGHSPASKRSESAFPGTILFLSVEGNARLHEVSSKHLPRTAAAALATLLEAHLTPSHLSPNAEPARVPPIKDALLPSSTGPRGIVSDEIIEERPTTETGTDDRAPTNPQRKRSCTGTRSGKEALLFICCGVDAFGAASGVGIQSGSILNSDREPALLRTVGVPSSE